MAVRAAQTDPLPPNVEPLLDAMDAARRRTLNLIAPLSEEQLEAVHSPIMSPLVWDLAHIAAYEDLWIGHRLGGHGLLHGELAAAYDAFETPRAVRGKIELLGPLAARDYLQEVREGAFAAIAENGIGDGLICEMVLRHELQHTETMRQTMAIAGLLAPGEGPRAMDGSDGWLTVPGGSFSMGAPTGGFAYDNERPRHELTVETFEIAQRPVTNGTWRHFSEGGGYERREWWSDEGWAWKEEYDISHHPAVATGHPEAPVCHVSWFEADAFARAHEARLPTEAEWERATTWDQTTLLAVGSVWEWTSSHFEPYPGFEAYPYREYSEVFFGQDYRVLRGGSWATHPRVASDTFRNWDLPLRRQIFAGLRLARKAGD
ncbi:MAG TPA: SUMF1/EgtB/PvdO family nonheme iron enzyme [Solirubrobacteraceae bacterium]|nr:SUMF1/EgtB/PvdO family nonheme iron enzyme [Solirubrobacteraceae bacterium]